MTAEASAHVNAPVPSIYELCKELPPQVDAVFQRALAKDPAARYSTAAEFVADLRHALADSAGQTATFAPPPRRPTKALVVVGGLLAAGVLGAVLAAIGIFLPVYLLSIGPAPWFKRHRENAQLKAFVQGATAAATGAIAGAVVVLALRAIVDVPTALVALVSLGVLLRWKLQEPVLVAAAGAAGLVLWSLLRAAG